jgi:hypothetical protein
MLHSCAPKALFLSLACFAMPHAGAATPAGATISNQATLTYSYGAGPVVSQQTNVTSFQVAQLIDVNVQTGEAGPVIAGSPDLARAMSFLVTNTGNGPDVLRLSRLDNLAADQFDPRPSAVALYIENGLAPGLQTSGPQADVPYVAGSNDLFLTAGEVRRVYLASDMAVNLPNGAQGRSQVQAESTLAGAAGAIPGGLSSTGCANRCGSVARASAGFLAVSNQRTHAAP